LINEEHIQQEALISSKGIKDEIFLNKLTKKNKNKNQHHIVYDDRKNTTHLLLSFFLI
jgi:hypothetical protein